MGVAFRTGGRIVWDRDANGTAPAFDLMVPALTVSHLLDAIKANNPSLRDVDAGKHRNPLREDESV